MKSLGAQAASLLLLAVLAGCAADRPKPTPLGAVTPTIAGRQVWSTSIGSVGLSFWGSRYLGMNNSLGLSLVPAVRDGSIYLASASGEVLALQAQTGAVQWRASAGGPIAAGVGSDGRYTSVVTRGNEVVTFEGAREIWRKRVPSSVVTPPLVVGERVFVMGVDRAVHAFDAADGRRLWSLAKPGDALTLSQAGVLAAFGNLLLVGQGQKLAALDPLRGAVQWELPMASPRGTNEVERLADLIGPAVRVGNRYCLRAFQSAVACADAAQGTLLWSRNAGGQHAVAADAELVSGADASDRITAWRAGSGDIAWTNEKLLYRGLSGALALGPSVVFGDSEGFLHFFATATGEEQLRLPTDGKAVVGTPVVSGDTLVVVTQGGGVYAFRPQ